MDWVWLVAAILTEVSATLMLRASDGLRKKIYLLPVMLGYAASAVALSLSIRHGMEIGVGYGIWAACGIMCVAVLARFLFRDALTSLMLAGMGLIATGVVLVEVGG